MTHNNDTNQPRHRRGSALKLTAVAVVAAAAGIATVLIFFKEPGDVSAASGSTPAVSSGNGSSSSRGGFSAGGAPSSGTQGGHGAAGGGTLPTLPPLSGGAGGLQLLLNGRVLAISSTSLTLGGNGPSVTAKITSSTKVSGHVTSASGIKVGDQVTAEVRGQSSSDMVAVEIEDPGEAPLQLP